MTDVFLCDGIQTPVGRYGGSLSSVRADDDPRLNTRDGAIALGHPLGMSGARLAITALDQLQTGGGRLALCTMCIGVGQGIAVVIQSLT